MKPRRLTAVLLLFPWFLAGSLAPAEAADRYVSPEGAGARNGTSFADAFSAARGGLQACWDALDPGDTCHAAPGFYKNAQLKIHKGGEPGRPKRLVGQISPSGARAVFRGHWSAKRPLKGLDFIRLERGAGHLRIESLDIRRYRRAVTNSLEGQNSFLELVDLDIKDTRLGIELYGDAACSYGPPGGEGCPEPERASHDLLLQDLRVTGATKAGIRFRYGVSRVRLLNCHVDMGGKAYDTDPGGDMVGFSLGDGRSAHQDSPDRDMRFVDCTARGAYNDRGDKYWQGDGFKTENFSTGVRFIRCGAFDNTDGGFDIKGPATLFVDCVAARNKRNFRLWNVTRKPEGRSILRNCLGHHAKHWGDKNSSANLHLFGDAVVIDSTFHNTMDAPEGVEIFGVLQQTNYYDAPEGFETIFERTLITCDAETSPGTVLRKAEEPSRFADRELILWDGRKSWMPWSGPAYPSPDPGFEGGGGAFDSGRYAGKAGFSSVRISGPKNGSSADTARTGSRESRSV